MDASASYFTLFSLFFLPTSCSTVFSVVCCAWYSLVVAMGCCVNCNWLVREKEITNAKLHNAKTNANYKMQTTKCKLQIQCNYEAQTANNANYRCIAKMEAKNANATIKLEWTANATCKLGLLSLSLSLSLSFFSLSGAEEEAQGGCIQQQQQITKKLNHNDCPNRRTCGILRQGVTSYWTTWARQSVTPRS